MYAALLKDELVLAVTEAAKARADISYLNREPYRCPNCRQRVILILSEQAEAFFKHLRSYQGSAGEQAEHHTAKMMLKAALTAAGFPAQVEVPLAVGGIRADVLANSGLAFEVQCAPLGQAEFAHRHALYQEARVKDIWVVGQRHYLRGKLKQTQLIYFRENPHWQSYYLEVDPVRGLLRLKYQVLQEPLTQNLVYRQQDFTLDAKGIASLWHYRPPKLPDFQADCRRQRQYLQGQIQQKTRFGLKIAEAMYLKHLTLADLPSAAFASWRKPGEASWLERYLGAK